jgi:hypothetical protein
MQLLEGFSGDGLLLIMTHEQQLQRRPLLVSRISLLLRCLLRHIYLRFETSRICLQFQNSCVHLQFEISQRSLQLKSSRVGLHLRLGVPRSLHLMSHRQRRRRMYMERVTRSSERCRPRQQRARNQWKNWKLTQRCRQLWRRLIQSLYWASWC